MEENILVKNKARRREECYLCGGTKFKKRPGSVRDRPELEIFECASCGLVFLSSFDHIKDGFYENSEMHGKDALDIQTWIRETEWDDERRFQYLKLALPNQRLLDFGCGAGGFLLKTLTVFQSLSDIPSDIRKKKGGVRYYNHVSCAGAYS